MTRTKTQIRNLVFTSADSANSRHKTNARLPFYDAHFSSCNAQLTKIRNDTVSLSCVASLLQLKSKAKYKEDWLLLANDKSRQLVSKLESVLCNIFKF